EEPVSEEPSSPRLEPNVDVRLRVPRWFFLVVYGLTGGTALAYEILWTRQLAFFVGNGAYAFSAMLASFLLGIGLGSWVYGRHWHQRSNGPALFGILQLGIGVFAVLSIFIFYNLRFLYAWLHALSGANGWLGTHLLRVTLAFVMMGAPTFLFGAAFPLVNRLHVGRVAVLGRGIGSLVAANGLGGICGSLLAAFVLLPLVGANGAIAGVAAVNIGLGATILGLCARQPRRRLPILGSIAGAAVILLAMWVSSLPPMVTAGQSCKRRDVLWTHEGTDATLSVLRSESGRRLLDINGVVTAADTFTDITVHKLLAHLPMLFHSDPQDVLIVGLGLGITANSATKHASVQRVEIAELIAAEQETATFFHHVNQDVLAHHNVSLIVGDGRDHIGTTSQRYDIISFNAVHPRLGASLYTRDFYQLCRGVLAPGGIVAGWIPTNWMTAGELRSIVATFVDAFPSATLWYVNPAHTVIIGSPGTIHYDYESFRLRLSQTEVSSDLTSSYLADADSLLSFLLAGPRSLTAWTAGASISTDARSRIEFSHVVDKNIQAGVLEEILAHQETVESVFVVPEDPQLRSKLHRIHEARQHMIYAELFGWRYGMRAVARNRMRRALELSPEDPYLAYLAIGYGARARPDPAELVPEPVAKARQPIYRHQRKDDAAHRFDRGMQGLERGDLGVAAAELEVALLLQPDYVAAHTNLGYVLLLAGDVEMAKEHLLAAIRLEPQGWLPRYHLGNLYLESGDETSAIEWLRGAIDRNPYYVDALARLAVVLSHQGRSKEALGLTVLASDVDPYHVPAF
ncbi:fused MFS/spermidine synthase, partial [Myxococcota bacterium]